MTFVTWVDRKKEVLPFWFEGVDMYKMEECWAVAEDYSNIKKADNLKEIEALEQRVKEQETEHKMRILAFKRLCKIYFDIASSVIGEESVRDLVNAEITEINDSTEKRGG